MFNNSDDFVIQWHPAIRCNEFYKEYMEYDRILASEFMQDDWICPNVSDISILNYPNLYNGGKGKSFNMIVNTCVEAARINKDNNLTDYNTTDPSECFDESYS